MSFDLALFDPCAAPRDEEAFLEWCRAAMKVGAGHDYNDPGDQSVKLRGFFDQICEQFPPLNGPQKYEFKDESDNGRLEISDYSHFPNFIYTYFRWAKQRSAILRVRLVAWKKIVGFLNPQTNEIVFPPKEGS